MRRRVAIAVLGCGMALGAGCHSSAIKAPVPISGSVNQFDSDTYRGLMDAEAAINSLKADIAVGRLTETPTIKTALNQAITDYNAANALWQAYHATAGATQQAAVQAAMTKLNGDVTAIGGAK